MRATYGYSQGNVFLSAMGSFWTFIFEQKGLLRDFLNANQIKIADLYFRVCEIALGSSLKDIPVFSRETWRQLIFRESLINVDTEGFYRYGDEGLEYGQDGVYYGGQWPTLEVSFKLEEGIEDIGGFLCNKVYNPSLILNKGQDFTVRNRIILFAENPFDNEYVPIRKIFDSNGDLADREISLWSPRVTIDKEDLYNRYGSIVGIERISSEEYKSFLRTLYALYVNGPKRRFVEGFLNAALGLPVALEDGEKVKYIVQEGARKKIYTERNIYDFEYPENLRPISVGDTLDLFRPFYNLVQLITSHESPGWIKNRDIFVVPTKLLSGGHNAPLVVRYRRATVPKKVGATFSLELDGNFSDEIKEEAENTHLKIGMEGFAIGPGNIDINLFDYVLDQFKDNLLFIQVNSAKVDMSRLTKKIVDAFEMSLPAFAAYILMTEISDIADEVYDTTGLVETIEIKEGHTVWETVSTGIDVRDGSYGVVEIGKFAIGDGTKIGEIKFMSGPTVIVKQKIC